MSLGSRGGILDKGTRKGLVMCVSEAIGVLVVEAEILLLFKEDALELFLAVSVGLVWGIRGWGRSLFEVVVRSCIE